MSQLTLAQCAPMAIRSFRRALPLAFGVLSLTMINPINPALAQEPIVRTLTVTGQGSESIPATLAQVTLGVEVQGATAAEAQQEVARRSNTIIELLRSRNDVTQLRTAGLYLNPVYDYNDSTPRITGYSATNTVSFEIPTENAGTIMDEAIQAGATRIDGIYFVAEDDAVAAAQQDAIREATQDAQAQADVVLDSLGLTRGDIIGIQVNGASYGPPVPFYGRGGDLQASEAALPTPVIGGEQEVQASVTLQITY